MHVVLVAGNMGPSNALALVQDGLQSAGHTVSAFFGKGQPFPKGTINAIHEANWSADVILTGLSSSEEQSNEELFAAFDAEARLIPFGFFCVTYGEFRRPWFKEAMRLASFLFVVNDAQAETAAPLAPNARIVPSGNPAWATYFERVSDRLSVRSRLGVGAGEKLVLCSGTKVPDINLPMWKALAEATKHQSNVRVFLARHPGEQNPPDEKYWELVGGNVQFLPLGMRSNDALCGADLLVACHSLLGIEAACKRVPVIDFLSPAEDAEWLRLSGALDWPPAYQGATVIVRDALKLSQTMEEHLNPNRFMSQHMKEAQERAFSLEALQGATAKIVETLTTL